MKRRRKERKSILALETAVSPTVCLYLEETAPDEFDSRAFQELLSNYPEELNSRNNEGRTPLMLAVINEHREALDILLGHSEPEVDTSLTDSEHLSALVHSIILEDEASFEALLASGKVDVNQVLPNEMTALDCVRSMLCVRLDFYKRLLEAGANASGTTSRGMTHLHYLCCLPLPTLQRRSHFYANLTRVELIKLQLDCAKLLLDYGLSAVDTDQRGRTPIHLCCRYNQANLLELLLQSVNRDSDLLQEALEKQTNNHLTPLLYCCQPESFYRKKYNWPAHKSITMREPETVFTLDSGLSPMTCVQTLLDYGAEMNHLVPTLGSPPLVYALHGVRLTSRQKQFIDLLLDYGAKTTLSDSQGYCAYHYAIIYKHAEVLDNMLEMDWDRMRGNAETTRKQKLPVDSLLKFAVRAWIGDYEERVEHNRSLPKVACFKVLAQYGAKMKFAIPAFCESVESEAVVFLLRELRSIGLISINDKDYVFDQVIKQAILKKNYTLSRYLVLEGFASAGRSTKAAPKEVNRVVQYTYPKKLKQKRSLKCSVCGEKVCPGEKIKHTSTSTNTKERSSITCERCMYYQKSTNSTRLEGSLDDVAHRLGRPELANLLDVSKCAATRLNINDSKEERVLSQYVEVFYAAGIRTPEQLAKLSATHLMALGVHPEHIAVVKNNADLL